MRDYKYFLRKNHLKQVDLANYLGVTESAISNIARGKADLSDDNLEKLLNNDCGWDVSMLLESGGGSGNINSVVNSQNFKYERGISAGQFLAYAQENQRQMGQLIDTIAILTSILS